MNGLSLVLLFLALIGFILLPIGLWRILIGAFSKEKRGQKVRSGMTLISLGVFLLIAGTVCQI